MLPKQSISLFFGATDQDTSKKRVQLGDLITARDVQQIKGGEFSKRYGFTATTQRYGPGGGSIAPDSIVSPDGVQVLARDVATDHVYARSTSNTVNQDQGHADRFVPSIRTLFPAPGSGQQVAPMAKQAGNYAVWLIDEGHFRIAQLNPATSVAAGSPTGEAETIVQQTAAISVATISGGASTKIKSFAALLDPAAPTYLWILWVDWSANIYAWKVPTGALTTGTFTTLFTTGYRAGEITVLTSVTAGLVDGPHIAVAVCGVAYDTTANFVSPGNAGAPASGFRASSDTGVFHVSNYATTIAAHMYLDATTGQAATGTGTIYTGDIGKMTAAACTLVSVKGGFQTSADVWYYCFLGNSAGYGLGLILVQVTSASPADYSVQKIDITEHPAPNAYGLPDDWSVGNYARLGWFYNGQIAARETANGVEVVYTLIPYYLDKTGVFRAWNPDYLQTNCQGFGPGCASWWTNGACVAAGWIRLRDYSVTGAGALTSGKDYLLTEWEDKDPLQPCYHLREWDTGEIVGQLAYGLASHIGHTGTRDTQAQGYYSDVQHPMLAGVNQQGGLPLDIVIGLQSQNQNACVDVAKLLLQTWDLSTGAAPIWQNPVAVMGFALSPGPIPTIFNGYQPLREAGPLVYPSRPETYSGEGSS